jgi:hypothetical protein
MKLVDLDLAATYAHSRERGLLPAYPHRLASNKSRRPNARWEKHFFPHDPLPAAHASYLAPIISAARAAGVAIFLAESKRASRPASLKYSFSRRAYAKVAHANTSLLAAKRCVRRAPVCGTRVRCSAGTAVHCFSLAPRRAAERRMIYEAHSSCGGNICLAEGAAKGEIIS